MEKIKNRVEHKRIKESLKEMINKNVLQVKSGINSGSIFCLEIGKDLKIVEKWNRKFEEGDYSLMIYCAWRLDDVKNRKSVTGWHESSSEDGPLSIGLKSLINDSIQDIKLSEFFDLEIYFTSGKRLSIFCDLTAYVKEEVNWVYGLKGTFYSVDNSLGCFTEDPQ